MRKITPRQKKAKEDLLSYINDKNGELLSDYVNGKSDIKIKCNCGFIWYTSWNNLRDTKSWCPSCSRKSRNWCIDDLKKYAKERDGDCLSDFYKNQYIKCKWKCKNGHIFERRWSDIINDNSWCTICTHGINKWNICDLVDFANKNNGEFLSEEYKNSYTKYKWRCKNNHLFEKSWSVMINSKFFCPQCSGSWFSEELCRSYFESILGYKFIKTRQKWLKNNNGHSLELDGYCKELNLAFEHNGPQHYDDIEYFNSSKPLIEIQKNDMQKINLCNENNITLIVIKELFKNTSLNELKNIIVNYAVKNNIKYNDDVFIDIPNKTDIQNSFLKKANDLIIKKQGILLSEGYTRAIDKLHIICNKGHEFFLDYSKLKNGCWCKECDSYNKSYKKIIENIDIEELTNIYISGVKIKNFYKDFGITLNCCYKICKFLKLKQKREYYVKEIYLKMKYENKTNKEIVKKCKMDWAEIKKIISNNDKRSK